MPRGLYGAQSPLAKLTNEQVQELRSSSASGEELAQHYGLNMCHVRRLRQGRHWPDRRGVEAYYLVPQTHRICPRAPAPVPC